MQVEKAATSRYIDLIYDIIETIVLLIQVFIENGIVWFSKFCWGLGKENLKILKEEIKINNYGFTLRYE